MSASNMFTQASKESIFYKVYKEKISDESFIDKQSFEATRTFLRMEKSAFWANKGHIPDDAICKVRHLELQRFV